MSIIDEIVVHEAAGALVRFQPATRKPLQRELFLTLEAVTELNDPQSAVCLLGARPFVFAATERWVRGERIYASGRGGGFLKRLSGPPPEIWEIRVTEPINAVRLFVRFARPASLVLTHL